MCFLFFKEKLLLLPFKEWDGSIYFWMDISRKLEPFWKSNDDGAVQWTKLFNVTNLLSIFSSLLPGSGNINNSHDVKLDNFSFIFLDVSNFLWVLTTVGGAGREKINLKSCLFLPGGFCSIVNFFSMKMYNVQLYKAGPTSAVLCCIPKKFWVNKKCQIR